MITDSGMAIEKVTIRFSNLKAGNELVASVPYASIKCAGRIPCRADLPGDRITMDNYRGKAVCGQFFAVITDSEYVLFGEDGTLSGEILREEAGDIVMADDGMLVCLKGNLLSGYDASGRRVARNTIPDSAVERIRAGY